MSDLAAVGAAACPQSGLPHRIGAVGGSCTTRRGNAHRTEERKVLYPWHPWAGCIVHIHEVIEKAAGDVVRCSHDDGASGRLLELPIWMFDPAACAPMLVETFPQADIAALQALRGIARCDGDRRRRGWARNIECSCFGSSKGLSQPESGRGPCDANGSFDTTVEAGRSSSGSGGSAAPTPEWRTLPAPTRQALTALMTRLIFDHAAGDHLPQPRKARHDV
jgi:hypothetical protein